MKRLSAAFVAAILALGAGPTSAQTSAPPPAIADFLAPPALSDPRLSPSGRYLALIRGMEDNSDLYIYDLETEAVTPLLTSSASEDFGGQYIDWVRWKGDDRLIVHMTRFDVQRAGGRADGRVRNWQYGQGLFSVARDGSGFFEIKTPRARAGRPGPVLDILSRDPRHILMTYSDGVGLDVAKVDVVSGEVLQVESGDRRALSYVTDRDGAIVGRTVQRGVLERVLVMEARGADGRWTEVFRLNKDDIRELPDYEFLSAAEQPGQVYVIVRPKDDDPESMSGVHTFDFKTRVMSPAIWRDERYDAAGIVVDPETNAFLGGCIVADTFVCSFSDPNREAVMTGLRRHFGADANIQVVSRSDADDVWILSVSAPHNPGAYYIYRTD